MDTKEKCFFCGFQCELNTAPNMHTVKDYRCEYCGRYLIDDFFIDTCHLCENEKFKIACILNERRLKGKSGVALSNKTDMDDKVLGFPKISIDDILEEFPQTASEFLNRILLNLSRLASRPFSKISFDFKKRDNLYLFTKDTGECITILKELSEQGLIRDGNSDMRELRKILTSKSWDIIEGLQQANEIHDDGNGGKTSVEWDVFICHASEDKEEFVHPLALQMRENGLKVWYDDFELTVGDSLRRSIDRGLAHSKYGIVIISPFFLQKDWPQRELDGLVALEVKGRKVILPVWHNVDKDTVARYSPTLADRYATSSGEGLEKVVKDLLQAIRKGVIH